MKRVTLPLCGLLVVTLLNGCGEGPPAAGSAPDMPRFDDATLSAGRAVWMGTCRNCHLLGVAGAPAVTDYPNWAPRIAKGKPALYHSALNGVADGAGGWRMPPRGGNARLGDQQVRQAVDYMVAAVGRLHGDG